MCAHGPHRTQVNKVDSGLARNARKSEEPGRRIFRLVFLCVLLGFTRLKAALVPADGHRYYLNNKLTIN